MITRALPRTRPCRRLLLRALGTSSGGPFPGPTTTGALAALTAAHGGDQYKLYAALHAEYGDVMFQGEEAFGIDIVTLFHPDDIERVIRAEGPLPRGASIPRPIRRQNRLDT